MHLNTRGGEFDRVMQTRDAVESLHNFNSSKHTNWPISTRVISQVVHLINVYRNMEYIIIFFCTAVRSPATLQFTLLANNEKVRKCTLANNSLQKNSNLLCDHSSHNNCLQNEQCLNNQNHKFTVSVEYSLFRSIISMKTEFVQNLFSCLFG